MNPRVVVITPLFLKSLSYKWFLKDCMEKQFYCFKNYLDLNKDSISQFANMFFIPVISIEILNPIFFLLKFYQFNALLHALC